jgi:tape measure domain-containing protein
MANEVSIDVSLDVRDALLELRKLNKGFDNFSKDATDSFGAVQGALKKTTSTFDVFQGVLASNVVVGAFNAIRDAAVGAFSQIADSTISLERVQTQFVTLTGSVEEADATIRELQEFTATTPFQFDGVSQAAAQLISFGFEVDNITPLLRNLGDVAAGSGSSLNEIALIFGQVSAAGKLTGERLLQLQERAIPIGPALAKTLGIAESQVREFVSAGKVGFAEFEEAFRSLSAEGGLFFEAIADPILGY